MEAPASESGVAASSEDLSPEQIALKERYIAARGYWSKRMERLMRTDPDYFSAYLSLSSMPLRRATMPAKYAELIYVAIDLVVPHLYADGARLHVKRALDLGATSSEVLEVLEIVSCIGVHSVHAGLDLLEEFGTLPREQPSVEQR